MQGDFEALRQLFTVAGYCYVLFVPIAQPGRSANYPTNDQLIKREVEMKNKKR